MPAKKSSKKKAANEPQVASRRSTRDRSVSNTEKKVTTSPSPVPKRGTSAKKSRARSRSPIQTESPKRGRSTRKKDTSSDETAASRSSSQSSSGRASRNAKQKNKSPEVKAKDVGKGAKQPAKKTASKTEKSPARKPESPKKKAESPKKKPAARGRSTTPKSAKQSKKEVRSPSEQKSTSSKRKASPAQKKQAPPAQKQQVSKAKSKAKATTKNTGKRSLDTAKQTEPKSKRSRSARLKNDDLDTEVEENVKAEKEKSKEEVTAEEKNDDMKYEENESKTAEDVSDEMQVDEVNEKEDEKETEDVDQSKTNTEVVEPQNVAETIAVVEESSENVSKDGNVTEDTSDENTLNNDIVKEDNENESKDESANEVKQQIEECIVNEESADAKLGSGDKEVNLGGNLGQSEEDTKNNGISDDETTNTKQMQINDTVGDQTEKTVEKEVNVEKSVVNEDELSGESCESNEDFNYQDKASLKEDEASAEICQSNDNSNNQSNGTSEEGPYNDIEEIEFVKQVDDYVENSSTKRKHDDLETELDQLEPNKRVKISTDEEMQEPTSDLQEDIAKDYVVVKLGDVPDKESPEVQSCLPDPIFNRAFISNPSFGGSSDSSNQFSVVSYNMLADCHLFRNDYSFTEDKFLQPDYRLNKLIKELQYLDGDVVCLQEVDPKFFTDKLIPAMKSLSYEGVFKKREGDYFNEGEATFYKTSRFDVVETTTSSFSELLKKETVGLEPAIQEAVMKYTSLPDVVVVAKLQCKRTGRAVTVGNVHIHWGEMKVPDAQCVQIASAVKEIVRMATSDNSPHIICGDFNSTPMSPGYLVARDGYPSGDETINTLMKIEGLELPDGKRASLVNSLWPAFQHTSSALRSAYSEAQGYEPEISSYNRVMCDCVDYVFYSSTSLENVGVLQTASKGKIMETGGIPNRFFPSDHVSLKVVLSFK